MTTWYNEYSLPPPPPPPPVSPPTPPKRGWRVGMNSKNVPNLPNPPKRTSSRENPSVVKWSKIKLSDPKNPWKIRLGSPKKWSIFSSKNSTNEIVGSKKKTLLQRFWGVNNKKSSADLRAGTLISETSDTVSLVSSENCETIPNEESETQFKSEFSQYKQIDEGVAPPVPPRISESEYDAHLEGIRFIGESPDEINLVKSNSHLHRSSILRRAVRSSSKSKFNCRRSGVQPKEYQRYVSDVFKMKTESREFSTFRIESANVDCDTTIHKLWQLEKRMLTKREKSVEDLKKYFEHLPAENKKKTVLSPSEKILIKQKGHKKSKSVADLVQYYNNLGRSESSNGINSHSLPRCLPSSKEFESLDKKESFNNWLENNYPYSEMASEKTAISDLSANESSSDLSIHRAILARVHNEPEELKNTLEHLKFDIDSPQSPRTCYSLTFSEPVARSSDQNSVTDNLVLVLQTNDTSNKGTSINSTIGSEQSLVSSSKKSSETVSSEGSVKTDIFLGEKIEDRVQFFERNATKPKPDLIMNEFKKPVAKQFQHSSSVSDLSSNSTRSIIAQAESRRNAFREKLGLKVSANPFKHSTTSLNSNNPFKAMLLDEEVYSLPTKVTINKKSLTNLRMNKTEQLKETLLKTSEDFKYKTTENNSRLLNSLPAPVAVRIALFNNNNNEIQSLPNTLKKESIEKSELNLEEINMIKPGSVNQLKNRFETQSSLRINGRSRSRSLIGTPNSTSSKSPRIFDQHSNTLPNAFKISPRHSSLHPIPSVSSDANPPLTSVELTKVNVPTRLTVDKVPTGLNRACQGYVLFS